MFRIAIFIILFSTVFAVASHAGPHQNQKTTSSGEPSAPARGSKRQFDGGSLPSGYPDMQQLTKALDAIRKSCLHGDKRVFRDVLALAAASSHASNHHHEPGLTISPYSKQKKHAIYYISNCQKTELPLIDLKGKVITKRQLKNLMQQTGLGVWLKQLGEQKTPLYIGKTEQLMSKRYTDHLSAARHHSNRPLYQFLLDNKENAHDRAIVINAHPCQLSVIEHYLIKKYNPSLNSVSGTPGHTPEAGYFYEKAGQEILGPTSPTLEPEESPSCLAVRSLDF